MDEPTDMLSFTFDGNTITDTNYWATDLASNDLFYVCIRGSDHNLMVPEKFRAEIEDVLQTTEHVILTQGMIDWLQVGALTAPSEGVEYLFEDHSDNPFCLHLGLNTLSFAPVIDPLNPVAFVVHWHDGTTHHQIRKVLYTRHNRSLPYRQPWTHS